MYHVEDRNVSAKTTNSVFPDSSNLSGAFLVRPIRERNGLILLKRNSLYNKKIELDHVFNDVLR